MAAGVRNVNVSLKTLNDLETLHERVEREQGSLREGVCLIAVERVPHECRERGWV
jgi:hypothetical protein